MSTPLLILIVATLGVLGWFVGNWRARASVEGKASKLHSRPGYYGAYVLLWTTLPALFLIIVWAAIAPAVTTSMVKSTLPENIQTGPDQALALTMSTVRLVERGLQTLSAEELETVSKPGTDVKALLASKGAPLAVTPEPFAVEAARYQMMLDRSGFRRWVCRSWALPSVSCASVLSFGRGMRSNPWLSRGCSAARWSRF